jgi:chaperone BCS1
MKEEVKKALLDDIQSYLDPETQAWYASRGLPYRRGYLLFGRPGTGKSSLSLSIAGCFGLEVYIVNIASIDDSRLSTMFTSLPPRCVVLLEDIDAVGVSRSYDSDGEGSDTSSGAPLPGKKSQGRVSLSGLLNALDGVGSTDGRVLIMTTNHIEHLDPAVIRPGRVDMKVEFQLADHEITRQLFRNMFEQGDLEEPNEANRVQNNVATAKLAEEFAGQIPSLEFSSADIISFLLKHRKSASKAVRNVSGWVSDERKRRLGDSWMLKDARSD